MRVDLRTLEPNPMRDFRVDPMDQAIVDRLKESIEEDGFWGGIICRKLPDGTIQIGAGHHRVAAALAAGYTMADVAVSEDLDDTGMIRVYARENATQRGNTGTATAGMVASAIRLLAKQLLTNQPIRFRVNLHGSVEIARVRGHLLGELGMGKEIILAFLGDIPSVNEPMVNHQLALLKESGHYDRIIKEIQEEIEREHEEALVRAAEAQRQREEAERREREAEARRQAAATEAKAAKEEADRLRAEEAEQLAKIEAELAEKRRQEAEAEVAKFEVLRQSTAKAAEDAAKATAHKRKEIFNYDGVNSVFTNTHQLRVFRELVTSNQFRHFIPFDQQPAIARQIKAHAEEREEELSGAFIRTHLTRLLIEQSEHLGWSHEDGRRFRQEDWSWQCHLALEDFTRHLRGLKHTGQQLARLLRSQRAQQSGPAIPKHFHTDLQEALEVLTHLQHYFAQHDTEPNERTTHARLPASS